MRTTRVLMDQLLKNSTAKKGYMNIALAVTGVAAAGVMTKVAYDDYKEYKLQQATHEKMQEIKSNILTFEDLLSELRKVEKPAQYALFWKHLYFNMHRGLLKSTRDYGTLLIEVNHFIERYYDNHLYSSDRTSLIAMHDEIINIILTNMIKEKLVTQTDLFELLDTIAIASENHKKFYAQPYWYDDDDDVKWHLPYADFQAYIVTQLLKCNIDGIFVDGAGMNHLLKCECISDKAKALLLADTAISARYFANVKSYDDFNLLLERAAPDKIAVIINQVLTNKAALANLKTALKDASLIDIQRILRNLKDDVDYRDQTGANQKHFLQALGDNHPVVIKVRDNMHSLVASKHLLLDAALYLNSINSESYCAGRNRVGFKH